MKTVNEIEKHIIGQIEGLRFEIETTEGYLNSCRNNSSFAQERKKEINNLKVEIKTLEELLKEIKE